MAHGSTRRAAAFARCGVGDAAAVVVPCQDRAGVGRPMRREHGVAGTLGGHDVGGGASDLEVIGIYLPASGEVGLRTVAIDRPPPDPKIRAN